MIKKLIKILFELDPNRCGYQPLPRKGIPNKGEVGYPPAPPKGGSGKT